MSKNKKAVDNPRILAETKSQIISHQWQDPLPDPHSVEHYQKLLQEAPAIIFREFQSDSQHRRFTEKFSVLLEFFTAISVIILIAAFFCAGVWFLSKEKYYSGSLVLAPTIIIALIKTLRKK